MTAEAFTRGVLLGAFKNFTKFTVKHLCWSPFLIKLQAWWCATSSRRKNFGTGVFPVSFSKFLRRTCLSECLSEMNRKNCIQQSSSQENIGDGILFRAVADRWAYSFFKKDPITDAFLWKLWSFTEHHFQNTAARLLLISCNIFNVSLVLSVINQFSHS